MCNLTNFSRTLLLGFLFLTCFFSVASAQTGPITDNVNVTAKVGEEIVVTPGGPSGGSVASPTTAVRFSGQAYPNASVRLLKWGQEQATVLADQNGNFSVTLPEFYDASILYSLTAEDVLGNRSLLINYPLVVKVGFVTHLSGVRFAPTIVTDKTEVKSGDYLTVSGYALPSQNMNITVDGAAKREFSLVSNTDGTYKIVLPLSLLPKGEYTVSVSYLNDDRFSKLVKFIIGELNILNTDILLNIPGDCNTDKIINLIDFSVLAFWYGKDNPPVCVDTNSDKKIDLIDFSILAFYWTG